MRPENHRILVGNRAATWLLASAMRRLILPGTFLILVVGIYLLWQYRFERSPGFPTIRLANLRAAAQPVPGVDWHGPETRPAVRLRVTPADPRIVVTRLDLPGMTALDLLHLRFKISSHQLTPGKQIWSDGRCIIEWHPQSSGGAWENNPIGSARWDQTPPVQEWVSRPDHPPATPALRVEHLGTGGDFELLLFEATVVRERWVWKIGRWVLMAAWFAWAIAWIGIRGGILRSLFAATVWLFMGLYFVIPGPWKLYHSMGAPFQIGPEIASSHHPVARPSAQPTGSSVPLDSVGEIPDQGDFTLRLKNYAKHARPLLHSVLLFVPTLLIACLVGRRSALSLAVILATSIEAAQFAFGYGFDWTDLFDLACDASGIALALMAHRRLKRRSPLVR